MLALAQRPTTGFLSLSGSSCRFAEGCVRIERTPDLEVERIGVFCRHARLLVSSDVVEELEPVEKHEAAPDSYRLDDLEVLVNVRRMSNAVVCLV